MAYAFIVHKWFIKFLSFEEKIRLTVKNMKVNNNSKNKKPWYNCENLKAQIVLKNQIVISILFDSKAEINFMNDKIRQALQLKMYFTIDEMTIWFEIDHVMNLIEVCPHLKIKIEKLKIYHHVFIVRNDIFFWF